MLIDLMAFLTDRACPSSWVGKNKVPRGHVDLVAVGPRMLARSPLSSPASLSLSLLQETDSPSSQICSIFQTRLLALVLLYGTYNVIPVCVNWRIKDICYYCQLIPTRYHKQLVHMHRGLIVVVWLLKSFVRLLNYIIAVAFHQQQRNVWLQFSNTSQLIN